MRVIMVLINILIPGNYIIIITIAVSRKYGGYDCPKVGELYGCIVITKRNDVYGLAIKLTARHT
jgi:hypothetical protein